MPDHPYTLRSGYNHGGPTGRHCRVMSCSVEFQKSLSYIETCRLGVKESNVACVSSFMT
jgi:hypothetical protein